MFKFNIFCYYFRRKGKTRKRCGCIRIKAWMRVKKTVERKKINEKEKESWKYWQTSSVYLSWLDRWWRTNGGCGGYVGCNGGLLMKWGWRLPRLRGSPQGSLHRMMLQVNWNLRVQLRLHWRIAGVVVLDCLRNSRKCWSDWRNLPNCLWNELLITWFPLFLHSKHCKFNKHFSNPNELKK